MMTTQTHRSIGLSLGDISAVKTIPSGVGHRLTGLKATVTTVVTEDLSEVEAGRTFGLKPE